MAATKAAGKPAPRSQTRHARKPELPVSGAVPWQPRMTRAQERQTVEESLGTRVTLADYRPTVTPLTDKERELLIDQARVMLEQVFVHLPLKRAMHGTDPVQRLRLLRLRHRAMDERAFQSEMADIFIQLRDLHTAYVLPKGYHGKFAFLPFRIEEFYEDGPAPDSKKIRKYMVTWVSPVNTVRTLTEQVVVTHWNGSPIELAVARNAAREAEVDTPFGPFGYVRLSTFAPESEDVDGTVREFARILTLLPPTGLILDVRGNGGGYIAIGERILQMITPREIVPEPFHFLATPLTLEMARGNHWLAQWADAIGQGIETGASFSQGFPLTPPGSCNDVGQVYQGPVVLITDARCYSTTDIFAAGFQDHEVGTIIGVHNNTGAGGANVWNHADVLQRLVLPETPFRTLPQKAGMTVAVRRSTRVGARSGVPLEDLGVVPNVPHFMTRNDVINHNVDLIAHAAEILNAAPRHGLRLTRVAELPVQTLKVEALRLDRIDVLVDGRTVLTQDVAGREMEISLPASTPLGVRLRGNGYFEGKLVVSTRLA